MRRHHDMGGLEAGPLEMPDHDHAPWEKQVDAIVRLLGDEKRRIMIVDEMRRAIEDLGPGAYDELSYYERWIGATTNILLEKNVLGVDELGRKIAEVQARRAKEEGA